MNAPLTLTNIARVFHACRELVPTPYVLYCVVRFWLTRTLPF